MRIRLLLGLLVACLIPAQVVHGSNRPRFSATQTSYLSCTVSDGHQSTEPSARSAQTPVLQSSTGARAYADVRVEIEDGACENTTTLYIASGAGEPYKRVYIKIGNGNGIELIGWSPNGDELLAEVNLWRYVPGTSYAHVALLYYASLETATEVPELNHALLERLGPNCEFERAIQGWKDDGQFLVKVSKSTADASSVQNLCVKRQQTFLFDLKRKALRSYQP